MNPPEITIVQAWPAVLDTKTAAAYIGESPSQFIKIVRLYPTRLRSYNLLPNGETRFDRADIDAFIAWRKGIGVERRTA